MKPKPSKTQKNNLALSEYSWKTETLGGVSTKGNPQKPGLLHWGVSMVALEPEDGPLLIARSWAATTRLEEESSESSSELDPV